MDWLRSVSLLSVFFVFLVAAQDSWSARPRPDTTISRNHYSNGQYSAGQHSNGQYSNGQHSNGQHSNGQHSNGQYSNGQYINGQHSNGQYSTGQHSNRQYSNGQLSNGQHYTGQDSNGQSTYGSGYWQRYKCREQNLNYDCIFYDVLVDRDTPGVYFGFEDVAQNGALNVTFKNSIMRKLPATLLGAYRQIELLELTGLQIEQVEPRTFAYGQNIRELYMGFNDIQHLPDGAFDQLVSLDMLVLDRNNLSSLPEHIFDNTANLTKLSLANNNLERIGDVTFANSDALQYLDVSSNKLTYLGLSRAPALFHVNASSNLLTAITVPGTVETLDASRNRITTVTGLLNQNLERLLLQHNNLTDTAWLQDLHALVVVDLSHNELERITYEHFRNSKRLKELHLSNNRLVSLNLGRSPIPTLKILDVRKNHLLYVENNRNQFKTLDQLYLDHNAIVTLSIPTDNTLSRLTLSHNDWDCNSLYQLLNNVSEPVVGNGDGDQFCSEGYKHIRHVCCKESEKPYLDRLIQHIRVASVNEKFQRAKGRCSATDTIESLHNLTSYIHQKVDGTMLQINPQLQSEIDQLRADIGRLTYHQKQLEQQLTSMHTEIDNSLRRYRVATDGLQQPVENLRKVFEHLNSRRTFKAQETKDRRAEAARKKVDGDTLQQENDALHQQLVAKKARLAAMREDTRIREKKVKMMEAKKNRNPNTRRITK